MDNRHYAQSERPRPSGGQDANEAANTGSKPAGADRDSRAQPANEAGATARPDVRSAQEAEIERLQLELAEANDRALRAQAELENFRKRAQREREDERRFANLPLLRDLLPVLDNIGRAIEAADKSPDPAKLLEGFKLVSKQLEDLLGRYSCVRIEAVDQPFDPHRHEAISQQPSEQHPANTVLMVAQEGYQLHERVIRPSHVIVSAARRPENA